MRSGRLCENQNLRVYSHAMKTPPKLYRYGKIGPKDIIYNQDELEAFVVGPLDALLDECRRTALRPNLEEIADFDVSGNHEGALFIRAKYKVRSGREVYHKRYFDRQMRL